MGANDYDLYCHYACMNGHLEIVKYLIEKGANDYDRYCHYASWNEHIVRYLVEKVANTLL
jgi:ankyrin repeat protein